MVGPIGRLPLAQQHRQGPLGEGQGERLAEGGGAVGKGLEVGQGRASPGLLKSSGNTTITGVINGMDRLVTPTQKLAVGSGHGPAHLRAGLARIAIDLALGVGAEVITIGNKAQSGNSRKNGFSIAFGSASTSAP